jgi:hypothetical protein
VPSAADRVPLHRAPASGAGRRGTIRDRLTGRTPRSERGGRGSIPCPGTAWASSSIAESACLTHKRLLVRVQPCPSMHKSPRGDRERASPSRRSKRRSRLTAGPSSQTLVVEAQSVERPPETRGVAGSTPADHIPRLRSSRESSRLLPGEALVGTQPGSPSGRTAIGAVRRLENGRVARSWGFDSLSFRPWRHGRAERQRVASA